MNNDRIHMQDQVSNQVDGIMSFYKKKPNKTLRLNISLVSVLFIAAVLFVVMA
jgi:hypothetical protein